MSEGAVREAFEEMRDLRALFVRHYETVRDAATNWPPSDEEIRAKDAPSAVRETAFDGSVSELDGLTVPEAIEWLGGLLAAVPEEHRATATLDVDCDEFSADLRLCYERRETDEEWAARKADVERRAALANERREREEREQFERLKAKFG